MLYYKIVVRGITTTPDYTYVLIWTFGKTMHDFSNINTLIYDIFEKYELAENYHLCEILNNYEYDVLTRMDLGILLHLDT